MSENTSTFNIPGQDVDLVYSIAAAEKCIPSKKGIAFAARSTGLYRSENCGASWEFALKNLALTETIPVTALAISPNFEHDGVVLAGVPGGIFHSSDSGINWKALVFPNPPPTISYLAFSPFYEKDETVFAGTMEDGIFISQNGGERWVAWNFGLLDLNVMCLAISPMFNEDETILAGTETGIFRSTNGGRAWREINLPLGYEAVLSIVFSPGYNLDRTIYAGTESQGLWVSTDAGENWSRLAENRFEDPVNAIEVIDNDIFVCTSTSLLHSTDHGLTWIDCLPDEISQTEMSCCLVIHQDSCNWSALVGTMDGAIVTVPIPQSD